MMGMEQGWVNNEPLAFNSNKGKPPLAYDAPPDKRKDDVGAGMGAFTAKLLKIPKSDRNHSVGDFDDDEMTLGMPPLPPTSMDGPGMIQGPGGMGMGGSPGFYGGPMGGQMGGPMGPVMMGPSPGDMMPMGNMMMFGGMGGGPWAGPAPMGNMNDMMGPEREIIRKHSCVLYPPPPNAPHPMTRERPPGCRTIFVGGLPETCTEEMLTEVFEDFGTTTSVRKSKKKNFAHVRFDNETSVNGALILSGYRMKVEDKDDKPNTGRLHVDFAMARDDQYEFECKQRSLMRDMRHRQRIEEERLRPPSPPPVVQYVEYEAQQLIERLKSDEAFMKASQVLLTWLERGEVSRKNTNTFYSMLQCTNSHIRRLLMEKQGHEEELMKMKDKFKNIFEGIIRQLDQIEKIFITSQKQRNWDHFTKAQRKNVELWLKQAKEIKETQQEELLSSRTDDDMEMSDDELSMPTTAKKAKRPDVTDTATNQYVEMASKLNELNKLRDENEELRYQMEAFQNEMSVLKQEQTSGSTDKDKEVKSLQLAMQGMQQQLITARKELADVKARSEMEKAVLIQEKDTARSDLTAERQKNKTSRDTEGNEGDSKTPEVVSKVGEDTISRTGITMTEKEAKLLGLVCCFLHVHPTGATVDYIWSYLHRLDFTCRVSELETLLEKMPMIFSQQVTGVGATIERRWMFTGYTAGLGTLS